MTDAAPRRFESADAEIAWLQKRLRSGKLDDTRLQVAARCGHPASTVLWHQSGHRGPGRIERRATVLVRRLFDVAPAWGLTAARTALSEVLRWTAPSIAYLGRQNAAAALANLEAATEETRETVWQAMPYATATEEPYMELERAAVSLWRAALVPSADGVVQCVTQCLKGLKQANFPIVDDADGERELFWAIGEAVTAAALGYRPASWRPVPGKAARWRIWPEEGGSHGGLFELERTSYLHVVDWLRKAVVTTYTEDMTADYDGGTWANYAYSGVKAIVVRPDGRLRIEHWSGIRETVDPAGLAVADST